ncbi:uncharacterized protein LOC101238613 [Trichonephila clavipes]|nr:uncharacterized protein LOC101238613 [Trichonephila clavipes]
MEVVGAYRIFERSNVRDVQYNEYYGDGDSKGYESVKNFYGINTVTKLECIGHVQKRVGGRTNIYSKAQSSDLSPTGQIWTLLSNGLRPFLYQTDLTLKVESVF